MTAGHPTDIHKEERRSALEVVMTMLHAGENSTRTRTRFRADLHGVGVSVVNALSETLEVEVYRDGKTWYQKYKRGDAVAAGKSGRESREGKDRHEDHVHARRTDLQEQECLNSRPSRSDSASWRS